MAAGKVLATNVHVERDGDSVVLEKGSVLPKWAAELVTNPAAFVDESEVAESEDEESKGDGYAAKTNDELKALLKERELPQTGKHDELVARLEQADKESEDEESEGDEQNQE